MVRSAGEDAVDMNLYSRQIGTIGYEAMCRLSNLRVLISGVNGTGVEVCKNLILGGPKLVTIHDDTPVSMSDLGSNCYLVKEDIAPEGADSGEKTRARACLRKLQELNTYVTVLQHEGSVTPGIIKAHDVMVVVDYDRIALEQVSLICREEGVKFIAVNSYGLCASIFVDFGADKFLVTDADGEEPKSLVVSHLTLNENDVTIQCVEDKKVPFGDKGKVMLVDMQVSASTNSQLPDLAFIQNVELEITSSTSYTITARYPSATQVPAQQRGTPIAVCGRVNGVKASKELSFLSYTESCNRPIAEGESGLITIDYAKIGRAEQLHVCTQAYLQCVLQLGNKLPHIHQDYPKLLSIARRVNNDYKKQKDVEGVVYVEDIDEDVLKTICRFAHLSFSPISVILGGIVAQEVVKATGKYTPIHQWLYYDCFELVDGIKYPDSVQEESVDLNFKPVNCRYDDLIQILGRDLVEKLQQTNLFLVGTGALGCEYIKNFALLGISTKPGASLTLTDMDRIEVSNLNRQFLFRKQHVGQSKSLTAAKAIKEINPDVNVVALEARVGVATEETVFTDAFWESLDVVVNALDNVPSRLYIDSKCVWHWKPLIESGTLGTKGNVQVVVPNMTQSYGDSRDPPDESIPLCTLRLFPNLIDHTMEWARDLFQGSFTGSVQEAITVIKSKGKIIDSMKSQGAGNQVVETLEKIHHLFSLTDISEGPQFKQTCYNRCVALAVLLFQKYFHDDIAQLLYNFPVDHLNNDGTPFWVGSKRPPQPIALDVGDELHLDFIEACANLYAFCIGLLDESMKSSEIDQSREAVARVAAAVPIPKFEPRKTVIKTTDEADEGGAAPDEMLLSRQDELQNKIVEQVRQGRPEPTPIEFEKDDDNNFHIQFIAAAGNLRARNYKIPEIERWKAKLIAGKIIPAIATTTAMVTGFATVELLKVLTSQQLSRKIESYKDLFANLSLPLWLLSEPLGPKMMKSVDYDPIVGGPVRCKPAQFSSWDKIEITLPENGTMKDLIDRIEAEQQTEVSILSAGNVCLYMSYGRTNKLNERMRDVVSQAAANSENSDLKANGTYCIVQACCTDEDGVDVNLPVIKCNY